MYSWLNWLLKDILPIHTVSTKAKKRIIKTHMNKFPSPYKNNKKGEISVTS